MSLISGWFDLTSADAKREVASYHKISDAIEVPDARGSSFCSTIPTNLMWPSQRAGWCSRWRAQASRTPHAPILLASFLC